MLRGSLSGPEDPLCDKDSLIYQTVDKQLK
jgi:hypothetical protein